MRSVANHGQRQAPGRCSLAPRRMLDAKEQLQADEKERHEIGDGTGDPHDDAGRGLVAQRGYAPRARHRAVMRIEHLVGEGYQRGQGRVLHVGQDQVRPQQPRRPAWPGRVGTDHRIPEQQAGPQEAKVLQVVPAVGAKGQP